MITPAILHQQAMDLLEESYLAKASNDMIKWKALSLQAFEFEERAARLHAQQGDIEPSRSILLKSAAILGLQAHRFREAERLAAIGLAGDPPEVLAEEFRSLIKRSKFQSSLQQTGVTLAEARLRISLNGPGVGYGIVRYHELNTRFSASSRAAKRTFDRREGLPFQTKKPSRKSERVFPYITAPMQGSFIVELMLAGDFGQSDWQLDAKSASAMEDLVDCFQLVESGDFQSLRNHIDDDMYYNNFMALVRDIVPDGEQISDVKIESISSTGTSAVAIRRTRKNVPIPEPQEPNNERKLVTISGVLRLADHIGNNHEVALQDENGIKKLATFLVPPEMIDDIVRPRWGQFVRMTGYAEIDGRGHPIKGSKVEFVQFEDEADSSD